MEYDQQCTFLILIELRIDNKTISMISDNKPGAATLGGPGEPWPPQQFGN